ncbi:MAG: Gfo/Idh/MocA family oxidoreductase [Chloroflexota bacterium]|nr:Gfo/Idh/MocA family oxidoreductase [Chloroflexota bacterium]
MIRVAILSFWHVHGRDYAREAEAHAETEVVAVWDEDPDRGRTEAKKRDVPYFESLDALLARPDIDGVIVTTPTSMHRDVMVAAASAGKHIFAEKVLAATLHEAEEILQAVEHSGVKLVVSMRRLADASTREIKDVLDSGALGDIALLRVRDSHGFALPTRDKPRGWLPDQFYSREQAQGGALIDLCHPVYLALHFLGLPDTVGAALGRVTGREVEDNAVVTLGYSGGALGVVETGYVARYSPFSIEVHGTQGSVLYSETGIGELVDRRFPGDASADPSAGPDGKLRIRSRNIEGATDRWLVREVRAEAKPSAFEQWVGHIEHGTTATENLALALDLTAVVEAAYRSAAGGRTVRPDSLERAV